MASATPSASVPGTSTSAPETRGVGGPHRHAACLKVADAIIAAAMRSSVRLFASNDHACTQDELYIMYPLAICDNLVKDVGILRQSCKERKKKR